MPEYTNPKKSKNSKPVPDWSKYKAEEDDIAPPDRQYVAPGGRAASGSTDGQGGYVKPSKPGMDESGETPAQRTERFRKKATPSGMSGARSDISENYDENGRPVDEREKTLANLGERMTESGADYVRRNQPGWVATPDEAARNDARIQVLKNKAEMAALPTAFAMRRSIPGADYVARALENSGRRAPVPVEKTRDITSFTRSNESDAPTKVYTEADIEAVKAALKAAKEKKSQ